MTRWSVASNAGRRGPLVALLFAASLASQSCSSSPTAVRAQQPAANTNSRPPPPPPSPGNPAAPPARSRLALPDSVEAWTFETFEGRVIRTAHYSIYTTDTQERLLDRLPTFVEAALTHYSTAITPLTVPDARMDTFLMANRSQWQRLTLRMLGERGVQVTYIERGGFTHAGRAYLFDIGPVDTLSLMGHEGWHQFSQTTFKERLPLILEEGIASFMEGHRWIGRELVFLPWANTERFDRLREAAANSSGTSLVSLNELLSGNPEALLARGRAARLLITRRPGPSCTSSVKGNAASTRPGSSAWSPMRRGAI
jgi:hypothetical protein